jgi:hypothetical protein
VKILKGKKDVLEDCYGFPHEFKISMLKILLTCDELGHMDYCLHHCILCA